MISHFLSTKIAALHSRKTREKHKKVEEKSHPPRKFYCGPLEPCIYLRRGSPPCYTIHSIHIISYQIQVLRRSCQNLRETHILYQKLLILSPLLNYFLQMKPSLVVLFLLLLSFLLHEAQGMLNYILF